MNKELIGIGAGALLLMAGAAAIASYVTKEYIQPKTEISDTEANAHHGNPEEHRKENKNKQMAQAKPAEPACNDNNIVGTGVGGVAGGVAGSTLGKGAGKTAATIGGVLGGAYLGNKLIPTQNVTCQH